MEFSPLSIGRIQIENKGFGVVIYHFFQILKLHSVNKQNCTEPYQTQYYKASDLVLQCLHCRF